MTRTEAKNLETLCDALMSKALQTNCNVSMALTGKLKVEFDGCYITFKITDGVYEIIPDYIKYIGYHEEIEWYVSNIIECLNGNRDSFTKLMWSYEHVRELEN